MRAWVRVLNNVLMLLSSPAEYEIVSAPTSTSSGTATRTPSPAQAAWFECTTTRTSENG